jgi:hypothetical protein
MGLSKLTSRIKKKPAKAALNVEFRPLMAIYGWLGDVSQADALAYAKGLATTNATNPDNALVYAMAFEGGYAYEIQEGGPRRPYLPSILAQLGSRAKGDYAYLSTARRLVRIDRDIRGISSVWMPEAENEPTTEGVTPQMDASMQQAVPDAAGWIKFGSMLLVIGVVTAVIPVIAFSVALPILFSGGAEEQSQPGTVPLDRWPAALQAAAKGQQVKALELVNGRWEVRATNLEGNVVPVVDNTPQTAAEIAGSLPNSTPPVQQNKGATP